MTGRGKNSNSVCLLLVRCCFCSGLQRLPFFFHFPFIPIQQALHLRPDLIPEGLRLEDQGTGTPAHDPELDFIGTCHLCLKDDELIVQFIHLLAFMSDPKITIYNTVYSSNNKYIAFSYLCWY